MPKQLSRIGKFFLKEANFNLLFVLNIAALDMKLGIVLMKVGSIQLFIFQSLFPSTKERKLKPKVNNAKSQGLALGQ